MGDINGDGKLEIVFISGAKIGVLDNQGKLIWSYNMQTGITAFRGVVLSDVNNDGLPDVILGNYGGSILALNGIDGNLIFEYSIAQIYGKQLIIDHGPLVADFNQDGLTDIFVVGGLTYYPQVENNYGRAYMITTNSASSGKDWLMFRANEERNAVLPINTTSVRDNYETKCKLFYSSFNDIDNTFKLYFAKELLSTVDISIVDILGNIIIQTNSSYTNAKANQISVNVSGLANGLYYILVKNESNISFNKILKY